MSSSPDAPLSVEPSPGLARPTFLALLEQVSDPRHRRGVRHRLTVILAVGGLGRCYAHADRHSDLHHRPGGHYLFTVKANQPGLYRRCKALPWTQIRATSSTDRTHRRQVRRTIKVAAAPQILDLPHAVRGLSTGSRRAGLRR